MDNNNNEKCMRTEYNYNDTVNTLHVNEMLSIENSSIKHFERHYSITNTEFDLNIL